jgi:hypothetical protein
MSCIDVNGEIHDRAKKNRHGQVRRVFEGIKNVKDTLEKIQRMRMKGGEGRESEREREREAGIRTEILREWWTTWLLNECRGHSGVGFGHRRKKDRKKKRKRSHCPLDWRLAYSYKSLLTSLLFDRTHCPRLPRLFSSSFLLSFFLLILFSIVGVILFLSSLIGN